MSAIGTKRTFRDVRLMSALGGKADISLWALSASVQGKDCSLRSRSGSFAMLAAIRRARPW
jgi:hypothetical protein